MSRFTKYGCPEKLDEAVEFYKKAIEQNPNDAEL